MQSNIDRIQTSDFLSLLGKLMYTNQTAPRSAMPSILSSYSRNPGKRDMEYLIEKAYHYQDTYKIPFLFYCNPQATDIIIPAN